MMRAARFLIAVLGVTALAGPVLAQGKWVGHRPPCKLSTGYYLVNGGVMYLKQAVESRFPDQRAGRLAEARRVLVQAITTGGQAENAGAWYYLGRYYAEVPDPAGADSAFARAVALAPDCAQDIASYTASLAAMALNDALRLWSAKQTDSAVAAFRLARSLDPADAEMPLYMALMYAAVGEPDSAAQQLEVGLSVAAQDTAHAQRRKQAELEVARAYEARAYDREPAVRSVAATRVARDSLPGAIARDSTLLARILADVGAMRAGGGRLTPQSLAAFQRDSTLLADRLAGARRAADSITVAAIAESTAVIAALGPGVQYYQRFVQHYPDETDAAIQLMRLYATAGDRAALDSLVRKVTSTPATPASALVQAGLGLYGDGLAGPAATLLEAALSRNPNDQKALSVLVHADYTLGRKDALADAARRLLAIDPLNPASARAMALAFDLAGQADSAARWVALADTGLAWNVSISQFSSGEHGVSLNGAVRNAANRPLPPTTLVFEFLDATGTVVFTQPVAIPALEPRAREQISVRTQQGGAVAWRYRRE